MLNSNHTFSPDPHTRSVAVFLPVQPRNGNAATDANSRGGTGRGFVQGSVTGGIVSKLASEMLAVTTPWNSCARTHTHARTRVGVQILYRKVGLSTQGSVLKAVGLWKMTREPPKTIFVRVRKGT